MEVDNQQGRSHNRNLFLKICQGCLTRYLEVIFEKHRETLCQVPVGTEHEYFFLFVHRRLQRLRSASEANEAGDSCNLFFLISVDDVKIYAKSDGLHLVVDSSPLLSKTV